MSQITSHQTAISMGSVVTLTGNSGGAISPNGAGNINIVTNTPTIYATPGTNPVSVVGAGNSLTITQNFQSLFLGTTIAGGTTDLFTVATSNNSALVIQVMLIGASTDYSEAFGGTTTAAISQAAGVIEEEFINNNTDGESTDITAGFVIAGANYIYRIVGSTTLPYNWRALVTWQIENR